MGQHLVGQRVLDVALDRAAQGAGAQQRRVRTVAGESLLERDFQLDEIRAASLVAAQGAGRCLLIEAPAGAGKSALLQAGSEIATREGLRALPARGSELETELAFGVVRQLLEPLVTLF